MAKAKRIYKSTDGIGAEMEKLPYGRSFYPGSHVFTEVHAPEANYWHVSGDFAEAVNWLTTRFGCGWTRQKYAE